MNTFSIPKSLKFKKNIIHISLSSLFCLHFIPFWQQEIHITAVSYRLEQLMMNGHKIIWKQNHHIRCPTDGSHLETLKADGQFRNCQS